MLKQVQSLLLSSLGFFVQLPGLMLSYDHRYDFKNTFDLMSHCHGPRRHQAQTGPGID